MGAIRVIDAVAISAIIFSGMAPQFVARGAGLVLFATIVLCLVVALTSGYRGVVSGPQAVPTAVAASVVVAASASMAGAADETLFATLIVLLILTTATAGACMLLIGRIGSASVLRFVPYPVLGGYLAGIGWTLALWALAIMSGIAPTWEMLPRFLELPTLWKWLPGIAYAAALRFAMARWDHFLVMPVSFILAAVVYHLGLNLLDISHEEATAAGLLLSGIAEHRLWPAFHPGELVHVDWSVVIRQMPNVLVVAPLVLLSLTMVLKGIQASTGVEFDYDREYRAAGMANMVAALGGGGPPGYQIVSGSLASWMFGAYSRLTGLTAALIVAAVLFGGGIVLQWFPVSLMGGLIFYIGADRVYNWLIGGRLRRLSVDYGIVLVVFLTVAVFGLFEGVVAGLVIAAALVTIRLAGIEAVETAYTARERRSSRKRPVSHQAILLEGADRLRAYRLRGYIFFGSAHAIVDRLNEPLRADPPPLCMLLDCTGVTGFDISALDALGGFVAAASSRGVQAVIVAPADRLRADLRRGLPNDLPGGRLLVERDIDRALERCEDIVIAEGLRAADAGPESRMARMIDDTIRDLDRKIIFEALIERLDPWLESRAYAAGETVMTKGEKQDGMHLIVEGQVSVFSEDRRRLRQHDPGDILSIQAAFGDHPAPADAMADRRCRIMLLTPVARRVLENDDPRLALELDRYVMSSPTPSTNPA